MSTRSHSVNTRANFQRADTVTWIGNSCGRHGSYIFYKAFRFRLLKPTHMTSSSGVVRTRRERRNTLGDNDVTKPVGEKCSDTTESLNSISTSEERILCLGEFFFVQCRPEDPVCVGELQLLWHDKHSGQDLSSTRLYYLPETTPAGRTVQHGQDEVLAVSEKVVMRTNDLASWVVEPEEWNYGCSLPIYKSSLLSRIKQPVSLSMQHYSQLRACVNMDDVVREQQLLMVEDLCPDHRNLVKEKIAEKQEELGQESISGSDIQNIITNIEKQKPSVIHCTDCAARYQRTQVLVLSLTSYCRHKAVMRRLEGSNPKWLAHPGAAQLMTVLGAITCCNSKLRVVFCRDTFDYSQLFEHDLICEEFAPVFKGRPRKKAKKTMISATSKSKKFISSEDSRYVENAETEKIDTDETSRNNRRRSKRRNPQRSSDDEGLAPSLSRIKRSRRGHASTPTPIGLSASEKNTSSGASKSEPSSPTDKGEEGNGRRRSKRRPRPRLSDLRIALRNSLLDNHKVSKISDKDAKKHEQRPSSSASSASDSSRSSSPTDGVNDKIPSPTPGSNSSAPSTPSDSRDAQQSPESSSPLDFSAVVTPPDSAEIKKDLDLTSETNMYLRALSEGHLPENKSDFLDLLHQFMRKRNTPIGRIPSLGFKKLDLWAFFKLSQEFGGYDMVTAKRLWKHVYDRMGGNPSCTSAATCTRKHFEKLLLPLELYIRQAVAKSKTEENSATAKIETSTHLTSFNGRTFDGDVYFPNSGKINSTALDDIKPRKTEPSPVDAFDPSITSVTVASSAASLSATTSSSMTSAVIPLAPNGFNLESLVDSVVHSQIMADQKQSVKLENDSAALEKTTKSDGNTVRSSPVAVIDLTGSSAKTPAVSIKPDTSDKAPIYSKPQILPPLPKPQVFTRTHCPRNSNAPPPFVPKPSAPKLDPIKPIPLEKKRPAPPYVDLSRIQRDSTSRDDDKLSKPSYNPSPPSPKRSRDSLVPESLHGNRSYNVSNLVSTNHKPPARLDRPISDEYKLNSFYDYQKNTNVKSEILPNKLPGFNPLTRPTPHSNTVYITRPPSPHKSERRISSAETSRISAKQAPISSETYRTIPNRSNHEPGILKHSAAHRYNAADDRRQKERSYYRPAGMLESHRQQQAKSAAHSLSNGAIKEDKHLVEDKDVHRLSNLTYPRSSVNSIAEPLKKDFALSSMQNNRPPVLLPQSKKDQQPTRTSFSSSFSVARLTSDTDKRPSLATGSSAPRVVRSDESRPHSSVIHASSSFTTVPRYVDPRQVPFKTVSEKDSYRPASSTVNDSNRTDRGRWNASSQSYNGIKPSAPSSVVNASIEKSTAASACRALLDQLPPDFAALVRSQMPPDCTPSALQAIISKLVPFLLPSAGSLPQTLAGIPFPSQTPILPEHLLRPEAALLLRNATGQQAAVNELTRAAALSTPVQSAEQLAILQMYNSVLTSALLNPNPALLQQHLQDPTALAAAIAASNTQARAALTTKLPAHSAVLGQPTRAPLAFQQPPVLVSNTQRSQQRGTEAAPGIPYPLTRR